MLLFAIILELIICSTQSQCGIHIYFIHLKWYWLFCLEVFLSYFWRVAGIIISTNEVVYWYLQLVYICYFMHSLMFVELYWNFSIWSAYISLIVLFQSNFNLYRHQEQTNTFVIFLTQVIEIFFIIVVLKCFQTAIIWRRSIRKCHNSVSCLRVSWLVICYE